MVFAIPEFRSKIEEDSRALSLRAERDSVIGACVHTPQPIARIWLSVDTSNVPLGSERLCVCVKLPVSNYARIPLASKVTMCPVRRNVSFCETAKGPLSIRKTTRKPAHLLTLFALSMYPGITESTLH